MIVLMGSSKTVTFPGQFKSLMAIGEFVSQAAREAGLDEAAVYQVELAVDEACSNIIEYAYGGEGIGDIECTCRIDKEGLTVILRDEGGAFDPCSVPEPDTESDLACRPVGGLGLFFMRKLMDEVNFEFTDDSGNVLTMVKYKEAVP